MPPLKPALLLSLLAWVTPTPAAWPDYRGPWGNGYASAPGNTNPIGLPLHWSATNNVKWSTEIPHRGWSTPVILDGQIWITTATEDGHDYFALCVDEKTGQIRQNVKLFHHDQPESLGNDMNSYATPSATIEPGRVYVHFGSFGTACLETATGKVLWKREDLLCRHHRGPSSSPVVFENLVILTFDGVDVQYLVALDKKTGATVWKTDRAVTWPDANDPAKDPEHKQRKAHSTPLIVNASGKTQMLSGCARSLFSYDPRTGKEFWHVQYDDSSVAPRPVYQDGVAYFTTGLGKPELWAVKTDGSGDVTSTHVLWKVKKSVPRYASPLLIDGLVYIVADESFVSCVDAATGAVVWAERLGGKFAASPVYADGRIYIFNREGVTTVIKPGRTYEALATNTLGNGFMASPAVDGKAFYLRSKTHLSRVEEAK